MDFWSCPCLLSEFTDLIKGIGLPQTLCVINISADQMQNTADLRHRFKACKYDFYYFSFYVVRVIYTAKENRVQNWSYVSA